MPNAIFWCTHPSGDMVDPPPIIFMSPGIPPDRLYCSVGGRLKSMSAWIRVPLGAW
jgi:hypothetical protein